ncbi:hypothetical protein L1987_57702 [Smallanthus sonchifolius]|uniref:Uncharacterized protein n=1 Tax=Smallanthus sonchifolius TaxID=185202 RepID=A0ACB9DDR3_9ASTR|nr:hypothetical protein L1987_57702 [Smallanthus sonchifolius]
METNQPLTLSSSSADDDPHDSVDQSPADEVSFGFNHLQIDGNDDSNSQETDDEDQEEEDDDDDGDFTFVCVGDNDSPTTEVFEDGQIRTVFPLFDQSLLLGGDYDDGKRRLPIDVPVDKVFIESPRRSPSEYGETDGTIRALAKESESGTPEINMKSNSTGFSKLWRFRNEMNRSNSDGRDAFVFLDSPDTATTSETKQNAGGLTAKVKVAGGGKGKVVKKGSKAKKSTASAHEVYLKQKGRQTEEESRRSYLPYRPGLMGFFTNVNGGLSKNVHPF